MTARQVDTVVFWLLIAAVVAAVVGAVVVARERVNFRERCAAAGGVPVIERAERMVCIRREVVITEVR